MTEYMLVTDDISLWYVIPGGKEDDWWDKVYPDDGSGCEEIPDYATAVNGSPDFVRFTGFRIKR